MLDGCVELSLHTNSDTQCKKGSWTSQRHQIKPIGRPLRTKPSFPSSAVRCSCSSKNKCRNKSWGETHHPTVCLFPWGQLGMCCSSWPRRNINSFIFGSWWVTFKNSPLFTEEWSLPRLQTWFVCFMYHGLLRGTVLWFLLTCSYQGLATT